MNETPGNSRLSEFKSGLAGLSQEMIAVGKGRVAWADNQYEAMARSAGQIANGISDVLVQTPELSNIGIVDQKPMIDGWLDRLGALGVKKSSQDDLKGMPYYVEQHAEREIATHEKALTDIKTLTEKLQAQLRQCQETAAEIQAAQRAARDAGHAVGNSCMQLGGVINTYITQSL